MNKENLKKNIETFLEIYKMFGKDVALNWFYKELDIDTKQ